MANSTNDEDLEIRLMKELHEIKLQLQEVKTMFGNSQLQFKMAISEHQTHCPMMHKHVLTKDTCYSDWKECHERHLKESGKSFDIWFERGKKLLQGAVILWILLSTANWAGVIGLIK